MSMIKFWRPGGDSGRRTQEDGGCIPVVDSGYKRRMDDRRQRGLGVEEVDPHLRNICEFRRQLLQQLLPPLHQP